MRTRECAWTEVSTILVADLELEGISAAMRPLVSAMRNVRDQHDGEDSDADRVVELLQNSGDREVLGLQRAISTQQRAPQNRRRTLPSQYTSSR
jgi:hypothetical protein